MEINEAIARLKKYLPYGPETDQICYDESISVLLALAEQYQSIKTLMPKKRECLGIAYIKPCKDTMILCTSCEINKIIDDITLAILKAIPTENEIMIAWAKIVYGSYAGIPAHSKEIYMKAIQAIHTLILERLNVNGK